MKSKRCSSLLLAILIVAAAVGALPAAGQIQVTSTNPSAAPQGTTNLNVTISGSGFKKGANAQWFVTGSTNPGGVTVNSTAFNGSNTLTANITIATGAVINGYDVVVTNTDGRTGKGTDKFAVTQQGTPIGCSTTGTPSGATLQATLNPVQPNGAALITTLKLGNAIRVRPLDLNKDGVVDTLVAFVASGSSSGTNSGTYVFFLDPATGHPQATNPVTGALWQNPLLVLSGARATEATAGDVNGDGIPDFGVTGIDGVAYLFVGSVNNASPSYTAYHILPPLGASGWGQSMAFGDVDGVGVDEVVVGASGSGSKRNPSPSGVFIFKYVNGALNYLREIQDPTGAGFGNAIAVGNIDGNAGNELVVGASTATSNGLVYVFPFPATQSNYFTLTGPGPNFGRNLGIADVNLDGLPDLTVITGKQGDSTAQALLFAGTVHSGESYTNQLLPAAGLGSGWGMPNIDVGDLSVAGVVAVGAPNAIQGSSCNSIQGGQGALHLFTSPFIASQTPTYVFQTPSLAGSSQFEFGYSVGVAPGYPFVVIGEHFRDVGTTLQAGQVYVYKLGN
jgi:hypothetical protein